MNTKNYWVLIYLFQAKISTGMITNTDIAVEITAYAESDGEYFPFAKTRKKIEEDVAAEALKAKNNGLDFISYTNPPYSLIYKNHFPVSEEEYRENYDVKCFELVKD